ncbi:RMD1 family protein [bacterium]|nr:RMD1 family protein [bacterium]MBU1990382.1 RMD1 family protein [bacterium]
MKRKMELFSFYLPENTSLGDIENALDITMKKRIEATYYAEIGDTILTYTQFNVLTMINFKREDIINALSAIGLDEAEDFDKAGFYQEYPLVIDAGISQAFLINNDVITLKEYSLTSMIIIAHVISQSVALEIYEKKLAEHYEKSRDLLDASDTFSIFKRTRLARFAKQLVLIRHDMLIELQLLDKPNILWDNEDVEMLYNRLASILELKDRFDIVEYKLNSIKDDIVMVMDLTNHNHSSFLEWIIIILIGIEIVMGLFELFVHS